MPLGNMICFVDLCFALPKENKFNEKLERKKKPPEAN